MIELLTQTYFRSDIRACLQGRLVARPEWRECLSAVAAGFSIELCNDEDEDQPGPFVVNIAPAARPALTNGRRR